MNYANVASHILDNVGGKQNVLTSTICMTRLRVSLTNVALVNESEITALDSVLGIVPRGEHGIEIVFGPAVVEKVYQNFSLLVGSKNNEAVPPERPHGAMRVHISPARRQSFAAQAQALMGETNIHTNTHTSSGHDASAASHASSFTLGSPDDDITSLVAALDSVPSSHRKSSFPSARRHTAQTSPVANKKILVLNGPNINMLGIREPQLYGAQTYADLISLCQDEAGKLGFEECSCYQSNHEGDLVDEIQHAYGIYDGIIFNPGAYTHTSIALLDALKAVQIPCIEVHISAIDEREDFRQVSYIRQACFETITGLGLKGYRKAIQSMAQYLAR
ncbi:type II 3-dehydroquinate dehydratase [Atopobium fossor]|uniref:type II 3-dehydroquinate dehydratase n=1 Tax=Atopobium fossor TaxID=39487 RepID=UPI0003F8F7AC|nr:type II 3-dehydroquinate dehydratase [Atopobium fossor]